MEKAEFVNEFQQAWRIFLLERELANQYNLPYQLRMGIAPRNPVLEDLLPSLFYIRAASI